MTASPRPAAELLLPLLVEWFVAYRRSDDDKRALAAFLEGLAVSGYAIVPTEASNAGMIAGLEAGLAWMKECGVTALSPFADYPSPTETTKRCYGAMVEAERVKLPLPQKTNSP